MAVFDAQEEVAHGHHDVDDQPLPLKTLCVKTLRILIPTDISNFLWMSSQTITLAFVGNHLGAMGTAQYSAGIIFFNMTGFSFIQGFGAAIDTISSQAYGKCRRSPIVGETLQLALVLDIVLGIFISIFFMNCEGVMIKVLGKEVGVGTAEFLYYCPLYLLVQIISGVMSKTMFAQKLPGVVAVANLAAACTSPISNYFLTPRGIHGAALSLFVTVACCAITHIACCIFHPRVMVREAQWPTPRLLEKKAWTEFFKVGIPSLVATCAEWWAFEFQAILAVTISPLALAIHGVAMNLVSLLFSVALGICVSASVVVGNSLGGMKPRQAKQYAYFIIICDIVIGAITAFFMFAFGRPIANFFSDDHDVVEGVQSLMPVIVLCHLGDSLQFCLQGIFRGAGKPKQAGIVVLATLWGVGVPASALFVLVMHTGVAGCIGGLLVGFLFEIPALFIWMRSFKWEDLALRAQGGSNTLTDASDIAIVSSEILMEEVKDEDGPHDHHPTAFVESSSPTCIAALSEEAGSTQQGGGFSGGGEGFLTVPHHADVDELLPHPCVRADADDENANEEDKDK